jgi:hypothetical protein
MNRKTKATPDAEALLKHARAQDWDKATGAAQALYQDHARRRDWDGLETALRGSLEAACGHQQLDDIDDCFAALPQFEHDLTAAVARAVAHAAGRDELKALYCEYFHDGGDGSSANLFLCGAYTPGDDDWASQFAGADMIAGPNVQHLLDYDPDCDFEPTADCIANAYARGMLLGAFGRAVAAQPRLALPVGFSEHDFPVVYLQD